MIDHNTEPKHYASRDRSVLTGQLLRPLQLSKNMTVLVVSLDKPLKVRATSFGKILFRSHSVLVPPDSPVVIECDGPLSYCMMDYLKRDFPTIREQCAEEQAIEDKIVYSGFSSEDALAELFRQAVAEDYIATALFDGMSQYIPEASHTLGLDPNVIKAAQFVRSSLKRITVTQVANHIGLSKTLLNQLFKEQTDVSLSRFIEWQMIFAATLLYSYGQSLSAASLCAGFSGLSGFTLALEELCGLRPGDILARRRDFKHHPSLFDEFQEHSLSKQT